jgi:hypothetical protein
VVEEIRALLVLEGRASGTQIKRVVTLLELETVLHVSYDMDKFCPLEDDKLLVGLW